ncbi:MAG: hypothetical protein HYZ59_04540 [Actinobacteria bacterium]|nr:hypothetical protein [Actinomycetota bacterium]
MAQSLHARSEAPLHPMTVADLLDGSFRLLRNHARVVFPAAAVFIVPAQLLSFAANVRSGVPEDFGVGGTAFAGLASTGSGSSVDVAFAVVAMLLGLLSVALIGGVACQVVIASHDGHELSLSGVLRRVRQKGWALLGGWLLVHLLEASGFLVFAAPALAAWAGGGDTLALVLLGIGFVLLVPIGFVVMTLSVAVAPCVVSEDLGPVTSIRRSWRLMRRRFWPVAGVALLAGLIGSIVAQILAAVPATIGYALGGVGGWVLITASTIITMLITQPFVAFVATLQYLDGRIRTEGLDLQIIADRLLAEEA